MVDVPYDRFFEAIGRSHTSWGMMEERLRDVFSRIVICSIAGTMLGDQRGHWVTGLVFYSSTNLRAKTDLIGSLIDLVVTDEAVKSEWKSIEARISKLYQKRNLLAHGVVYGNDETASTVRLSIWSGRHKELDYSQVAEADQDFKEMADRLERFAVSINTHLKR